MNLFDETLCGLSVTQVVFVHDYLQLVLGDDITLTVNNDYKLDGGRPKDFVYSIVQSTQTTRDAFTVHFDASKTLTVSLFDQSYHGPEAMVLNRSADVIVW